MNQIISHLEAEKHFGYGCAFWNSHDDWFLERDQVKVHRYNGSLCLTDITDAMKPGKACEEFHFSWWPHDRLPVGLPRLFERHGYNLRAVFNELRALPWEHRKHWNTAEPMEDWQEFKLADLIAHFPKDEFGMRLEAGNTIDLFRSARPSIRVWSPFYPVKPLAARPAKWTVAHVVRALLAGQFTDLTCTGVYTDDYAYDAACDFQRGKFREPSQAIAFARRILERPSGWWASTHGEPSDHVSICCHHFDNNSFKFDLMKRFNPAAQLAATSLPDGDAAPHAVTVESPKPKAVAVAVTKASVSIEFNEEKKGIELHFKTKPSDDIRDELKGAGFRWSRFSSCWYVKDTPEKRQWADQFMARLNTASPTDPEAALRKVWNEQGVPKEKQDAIIADTTAKAQPGAMVGPFQIPTEPMATHRLKVAWIRDDSQPVGQPGTGAFPCACGHKVPASFQAKDGDVTCTQCGQVYSWDGWLRGRAAAKSSAPTCVFCGRSGNGVQFAIFNPRFKPFGTACVECEANLPEGTVVPAKTTPQVAPLAGMTPLGMKPVVPAWRQRFAR